MTGEADVIAGAGGPPATVEGLTADLAALGVEHGDVIIVHSALSRLGWVVGGAHSVVLAMLAAVGEGGTVVVPTHSGHLSDPAQWTDPPVPASWIPVIRANHPAYDPRLTPTRLMGAIVECFRHVEGVVRGPHPRLSFAAHGPLAAEIVTDHQLGAGLGPRSPLGRLYDLDAKVVLLGVDHANNTSLHLAEYGASYPDKREQTEASPVLVDGERQWVTYRELAIDESDFALIGRAFAETGAETQSRVGAGLGRLCRQRHVVDFAVQWMERVRR